ncbi:hypothetical protein C8J57DRAFT_321151 [Mycena rebaudengoi]|nr:hypothetical protein C8J57DRAFT_321151 [Mycena rebaudengoi]
MSQNRQIAVFPFSLWGHARPIPAWAARLSKRAPSFTISCFVPSSVHERFLLELTRQYGSEKEALAALESRIKITVLDIPDKFASPAQYEAKFVEEYTKLCASDETHPDVVVCDVIMPVATFDKVHFMAKRPVKVVCWNPIAVSTVFSHPFREWMPDMDAVYKKIYETRNTQKIKFNDAADIVYQATLTGNPVNIPGFPQTVDYEGYPQEPPKLQPAVTNIEYMENIVSNDAMISISAYDLEPHAFDGLKALLGAKGAEVFALGPFMPDVTSPEVLKAEMEQSTADSQGIVEFLDGILATKGERSALYLSFGTIFYPTVPEKLHAIINVVIELGIPVVFVHPEHAPPISEDILAKFAETGLGYVCTWAPQQYVLNHPAISTFLSHGGLNSTLEALYVGMPILSYPQYGDQPFLAILVEQVVKCGYEFTEVRQGHGLQTRGNGTKTKGTIEDITAEARRLLKLSFFDEADRKEKRDAAMALSKKLRAVVERGWTCH